MKLSLLLLLLVPIVAFAYFTYKHLQLRKRLGGIPSVRSLPFIGHVHILRPDIEGFIDQVMGIANLYPDPPRMSIFWALTIPSVMVYSPELLEPVLSGMSSNDHLNKGMFYELLRPWLGNGLLTSYPGTWRSRRKLLTPTFHYEILKSFVHVFNYQSEILINQLRSQLEKKGPEVDDISRFVSLCALDIICETSMGQSVDAQLHSDSDYVRAVLRINDIIQRRQKNPVVWNNILFWLFSDGKEHAWALNILHSFTRRVIRERRQKMLDEGGAAIHGGDRMAFLDLLLEMEQKGQLTETDIQEEVDTFMFEGHDTTSAAITWTLHLLGCHPEIQEGVVEEILQVCGSSSDISMDQLGQLKYLERCIKEALRLYPSVPIISRRLGADANIGGITIPAGVHVLINIYLIHRDPQQWKDPEVFNPDRFLPENSVGRHAFAFVPFSAGSRNCIGQRFALLEEKCVLSWILRNFRVQSVKRRDQLRPKTELILRPVGTVPIHLTPRDAKEE